MTVLVTDMPNENDARILHSTTDHPFHHEGVRIDVSAKVPAEEVDRMSPVFSDVLLELCLVGKIQRVNGDILPAADVPDVMFVRGPSEVPDILCVKLPDRNLRCVFL